MPEPGASTPLDFSPEATAVRIYEFSVSMFAVYQAQNPDESSETALANYEQLAREAIEEGFKEAILEYNLQAGIIEALPFRGDLFEICEYTPVDGKK